MAGGIFLWYFGFLYYRAAWEVLSMWAPEGH
jgi:hypothetical protein